MKYWLNKTNGRYYKVFTQTDMLNDLILTCVWGSIKSNLGNYSHTVLKNPDEANEIIKDINTRRLKRGYELM